MFKKKVTANGYATTRQPKKRPYKNIKFITTNYWSIGVNNI